MASNPNIPQPSDTIIVRPVSPITGSVPPMTTPIIMTNSPTLQVPPANTAPAPQIAQRLTAIPLGYQMAYNQLVSPTPYGNKISAYRIYRNTKSNAFSGALLIRTIVHDPTHQGSVTVQDSVAGAVTYYYFITAVDSFAHESSFNPFQSSAVTSGAANPNIASVSVGPGSTTNSATPSQIPSLSKTLTTTGKNVLVSFTVGIAYTVSGTALLAIYRDGSAISGNAPGSGGTGEQMPFSMSWIDSMPSAGSHTYAVYWSSSTSTQIQTVGIASLQIVELG